ncbi:phage protein Gp27 family protein [Agrobacterium tumefaciens]|uniref:phage protein Gp27 family protein n=1 Tax=Agrobacterium tumefaciens TaxID=358 RepID=UPI00045AFA94|nr:phage protein Gp27 family protein [Agrobacterium tumefaciens]CDN93491.1 Methyl-accepting chemotaxis protein [Agrobacterium tumefaciens]
MAKGRGRLSNIQLLPQECSDIVIWAAGELQQSPRTQQEIYEEFVLKLQERQRESHGELDIKIPSKSAFNRYSIDLDATTREMNEAREMATAVLSGLDHDDGDSITKFVGEALKAAVMAMLRAQKGKLNSKNLNELASTMRMVTIAQATSATHRQKLEAELAAKTKETVEEVGRKAGISQETLDEISRRLGAA